MAALVPPEVITHTTQFLRQGIKYAELSEEQRQQVDGPPIWERSVQASEGKQAQPLAGYDQRGKSALVAYGCRKCIVTPRRAKSPIP